MENQESQTDGCLHPLGLEVVPLGREGRGLRARQGRPRVSVFLPPVPDIIFESVSITVPSKRHSVPCSTFWRQHRPSYEREAPQRMQVARHRRTDQSVQRYEKSARLAADYLALPRRTRELIETFAPHAEGAIFGTSFGSACTFCSQRCRGQPQSSLWCFLLFNV